MRAPTAPVGRNSSRCCVKYRHRRPINGVILTISAKDLMTLGASGREAQVEAARLRLRELNRELQIQLPVYVMVTMCDMVAGFAEYFDDLAQDTRAQVWGVTFPYEQTLNGESTQRFVPEFEALITRLNQRLFTRLDEDRDVRRRTTVFAFPQQMAALRDSSRAVCRVRSSNRRVSISRSCSAASTSRVERRRARRSIAFSGRLDAASASPQNPWLRQAAGARRTSSNGCSKKS